MTNLRPLCIALVIGCGSQTTSTSPPTNTPPTTEPAAGEPAAMPMPVPPAPKPSMTIEESAGLATPESVAHDTVDDVYLISNINGGPSAKDGNGFISRVSPDGKMIALKWIDGSKPGSKLDAPKGLAIAGDVLYVADLDTVRMFDRKTGKAKGEIAIKGSTFLNDVAVAPDGKIYVTDSGIKIDDKGITPTKTDAVWVIEGGKPKVYAKGEDLGRPNGISVTATDVWVGTFGSGELYKLAAGGAKSVVRKYEKGQFDGVLVQGDVIWLSSWEAEAMLVVSVEENRHGDKIVHKLGGMPSPADFAYDAKRDVFVIPLFTKNRVVAFQL